MFAPSDICQEALDLACVEYTLGDIETEGTREAQVLLRKYRPCLAALLRSARWTFARKQQPMQILGDITGTLTASQLVIQPWTYEYALPNDCVQARFVPFAPLLTNGVGPPGNISLPPTPISATPGAVAIGPYYRLRPSRFLISRDTNYPPTPGQNWEDVQGVSPAGQTVVLSDVPCASLVYTSLVLYPNEWDSLFREALVAYLASEVVGSLQRDKRLAMQLKRDLLAELQVKVMAARVADANEGWPVNDHIPDWIRARHAGGRGFGGLAWGSDDGPGYFTAPYAGISFSGPAY